MLDIYSTENLEKQYWFLAESTTLSLDQICDIRDYPYGGDDYIIKHVSPELREVLVLNQLTKDAPILRCAEGRYMVPELTSNMLRELRCACSAKYKYLR